jgi:hypothetical protein
LKGESLTTKSKFEQETMKPGEMHSEEFRSQKAMIGLFGFQASWFMSWQAGAQLRWLLVYAMNG